MRPSGVPDFSPGHPIDAGEFLSASMTGATAQSDAIHDQTAAGFCLQEPGSTRELNCWALFIFFDGVNIHTGIGPTTTQSCEAFKRWVDTDLEPAWKLSEYGHFGVRFGNFEADQHQLCIQDNFATHGQEILGGQESWANRLRREIFYQMWNQLQTCNLDLEIDPNDLMQSITFRNSKMRIREENEHERHDATGTTPATTPWKTQSSLRTSGGSNTWIPATALDFSGTISQILEHVVVENKSFFCFVTANDSTPKLIAHDDSCLSRKMVAEFTASELKKVLSVPILDHNSGVTMPGTISSGELPDIEMLPALGTGSSKCKQTECEAPDATSREGTPLAEATHSKKWQKADLGVPDKSSTDRAAKTGAEHGSTAKYDIEKILKVQNTHSGKKYLVSFTNYESPEWVHESDLRQWDNGDDGDDSQYGKNDKYKQSTQKKRQTAETRIICPVPVTLPGTTTHIESSTISWCKEWTLISEVQSESQYESKDMGAQTPLQKGSEGFVDSSARWLIQRWLQNAQASRAS
ncbi:hypothetical protein B0H10DRAFT_1955363 [Mycena sp. CBHHK59/15]|nr:hypothetical protein B0H10DRAFT_1955363 [Mycena sp. CBHHK59/15]